RWLGERFRERGYATAAIFGNEKLPRSSRMSTGFEEITVSRESGMCRSGPGFLLSMVTAYGGSPPPLCTRMLAGPVVERARSFVRRGERPYLLALNFMDPHNPYYVPRECRGPELVLATHAEEREVVNATPNAPAKPAAIARVRAQYRAALTCMDRTFGALLEEVDDGNTVIAIVADHGEHFGEHGFGGHGVSLYRELLHVPLLLKVPGAAPTRIHDAVSTADLYETLVRAADPSRARAPLPLLDPRQRRSAVASYAVKGAASGYSITRGDTQLIRYGDGREMLFGPAPDAATLASMRDVLLRAARQQQRRVEFESLGYLR
ncbi:MAG TPA: sulfatase-like hydrolase/transferase, partial [Thermoanaerobaculia bacterium]|nr:sulfatase-like hydrolase/transferase [Thermoanaerobaculia bacterium]